MNTQRIMIGTAQFGMDYGIANKVGQVKTKEIEKILALAQSKKINRIDTAPAYGNSESILGQYANHNFHIITKLSSLNIAADDIASSIRNQCHQSLERLNRESNEGILVHQADDLLGPKGAKVYEALFELKLAKIIKKIGVSVYSPEQVYALTERFQLDIIQFPLNILDQRFIQNELLKKLKNAGIELHARSIFLQGLLLMPDEKIHHYFTRIKPLLLTMRQECDHKGLHLRLALIEFVMSIKEVDYFIFGIDSHQQLNEIINDTINCESFCRLQADKYASNDLEIINPTNWKVV